MFKNGRFILVNEEPLNPILKIVKVKQLPIISVHEGINPFPQPIFGDRLLLGQKDLIMSDTSSNFFRFFL